MSPSVRLSRSWTLSSPMGSTADRQSPSVPSVSFLLGGVLPPQRRGGTCPSSSRTVRGRLATNLLVGTRCSPLRPPSRATVLSHAPPLCVPQPEPAWHHGDTLRAFHAPSAVRRDHKQGRLQPPQETVHPSLPPSHKECVFSARPGLFIKVYVNPIQPFLVITGIYTTPSYHRSPRSRVPSPEAHPAFQPLSPPPRFVYFCHHPDYPSWYPTPRCNTVDGRFPAHGMRPAAPTALPGCLDSGCNQPLLGPLHRHGD